MDNNGSGSRIKIPGEGSYSYRTEDYFYELPEERIAKYPLQERDLSKLLVYRQGKISHDVFRNIPSLLPPDSLLVFNDTRVIQARLIFHKPSGAPVEIFCLEPHDPADYALSFAGTHDCSWRCLIGNRKKWKKGPLEMVIEAPDGIIHLTAEETAHDHDSIIRFSWDNSKVSFARILELCGEVPLPPYLHRKAETTDKERYQTVYAKYEGSVAAPTAGLHFTGRLLDEIDRLGIPRLSVTLHVGAGTFIPVQQDDVRLHAMHTEHFIINKNLLETLIHHTGPVIAVGTTTVRTLESLYLLGARLALEKSLDEPAFTGQWEWNELAKPVSAAESIMHLQEYLRDQHQDFLHASTQLMIVPGFRYHIVNGMVTNFHQPQSTLLMLVAAFIGEDWKKAYRYALQNDFRFLSYGDACLFLP